jgi:hypothetical protein
MNKEKNCHISRLSSIITHILTKSNTRLVERGYGNNYAAPRWKNCAK